ncbi:hypothetical protein ABPG75_009728 [Micractinium tetrahymenae]
MRPDECPALAASFEAEAAAVVRLLELQPCSALHFDVPHGAASGRHTTHAMHAALGSWRFQEMQAGCLQELAVHGWLATRELCASLPDACPGLRRLLLSGCASRLDLSPLRRLPQLHTLVLQTDLLSPADLAALPRSLRSLELEVAGVGVRVCLPPHLELHLLSVSCSHGRIFAPAPMVLKQCRQVELKCGTAVLLGLLDGQAPSAGSSSSSVTTHKNSSSAGSSSTRSLVQRAAQALVAAFLRQPTQVLQLQARRLAFALPVGGQSPDGWPAHPHQLRYVQARGFEALLEAALPHWLTLEAAPVDYVPADSPAVQSQAPSGVALCKRSAGCAAQRGVFRLPPLQELPAVDVSALAIAAAPAELHFSPGCSAAHQAALLRVLQAGGAPAARLRRLANCRLGPSTDLSAFSELESVSGFYDCDEAGKPPAQLPPSLRQLALTGSPAAVLDGMALLAGFSGSLTAWAFSALRLPASSRLLQLDWAPNLSSGINITVNDASLQLDGRADRLFLRLPVACTAAVDAASSKPTLVQLGGRWLGQASLVVIDARPAGDGAAGASAPAPAATASGHSGSRGSSGSSTAIPAVSQLRLAFPGRCLADLFSGALGSAAAAGLQRLELLCGPSGMLRYDHAALRFVACDASGAMKEHSLRDLLRLPAAQRGSWRLTLAAEPWRVVLAREA